MTSYTRTRSERRSSIVSDETDFAPWKDPGKAFHLPNTNSKGYTVGEPSRKVSKLALYQGLIFGTLFVGYASYTYVRKIFSYAAPTLMGLQLLSQSNMGVVNSSQNLAYAISKFVGGILSDKISAKFLFPLGLFISGLTAISIPFSSNPQFWALLWFMNGIGQGCGWPACSKLLKKWFSSKQFGTCWSLLTASSNVAGTIGPIVAAYFLVSIGWKTAFIVSGSFTLIIAVLSLIFLQDSPKDISLLSPNDDSENEKKQGRLLSPNNPADSNQGSYNQLLKTPLLWIISFCYLIVFGTKTVLSDWGQIFLMNDMGQTQMQASTFSSAMETGGFIGGILAGVLTDKLHRTQFSFKGNTKLMVSVLFMLTCVLSLHALIFMISNHTSQYMISAIGMLSGGALFGPISIFGIVASESFPPAISGAAHAVVALAASIGAIVAGYPFSSLALSYGWKNCLFLCEVLMVISILVIFATTRYQKSHKLKSH